MQKKSLIALAVINALAAPAAMAEVTIYGQANVSYDVINNGDSAAGVTGTSATKVSSNTSRLGFKGSEDLGNGTSAIWQIESSATFDRDSGSNGFGSRPSFAGLKGENWGSLVLGHVDSPSKIAIRRFDQFTDTRGDGKKLINYSDSIDAVVYTSPSMNGFTLSAAYGAAAESASLSTNTKGSNYSLSAVYAGGPLTVSLGYDNTKSGSTGTGNAAGTPGQTISYTFLGMGYTVDALTGNLLYQRKSDSLNIGNRITWMVNGKYSFGSDAVKLQYIKAGTENSAANTGATHAAVGYDHSMSKNTTVYTLYTRITNDSAASFNLDGAATLTGAGADPSGWSIGMKHKF